MYILDDYMGNPHTIYPCRFCGHEPLYTNAGQDGQILLCANNHVGIEHITNWVDINNWGANNGGDTYALFLSAVDKWNEANSPLKTLSPFNENNLENLCATGAQLTEKRTSIDWSIVPGSWTRYYPNGGNKCFLYVELFRTLADEKTKVFKKVWTQTLLEDFYVYGCEPCGVDTELEGRNLFGEEYQRYVNQ